MNVKFLYFGIGWRGKEYEESYYIIGYLENSNEYTLGFFEDEERAQEFLNRIMMGHEDRDDCANAT